MSKKTRHNYDFKKSHTLNKTKSKQNDMQSMLLSIDNNSQTGGANPPYKWFQNIFGFDEKAILIGKDPTNLENYFTIKTETINANDTSTKDYLSSLSALFSSSSEDTKVEVQKHTLICSDATNAPQGFKSQYIGMFDRPNLAQLEQCINSDEYKNAFKKLKAVNIKDKKKGGLTFKHIVTQDVALLHCDPKNEGAIFQVASQFNCLEMISDDATPKQGVTMYTYDNTQGPACAMACPAALVYRNYFVEHTNNAETYNGQCTRQIDNLEDINDLLENTNETYWTMRNGYVIVNDHNKLQEVSNKIATIQRDSIINALRVGVHWSTSVIDYPNIDKTKEPLAHRVCQVYASALPVSPTYNPSITNEDVWEPFATCILDGSYMATLCIAALIAIKSQTRIKCYLTLIGGSAFGNKPDWIIKAIEKALDKYKDYPIDVMLVHHKNIDTQYSTWLKTIGEIITDLPEKCGLKKFDIDEFLEPITDDNKTIKEITDPNTNKKMKLYAIQGSLVDFKGDVMVNAANEACLGGGGIDKVIHESGGIELYKACNALPLINDVRCPTGQAKTTIGGNLNTCLCIHAVGPNYNSYVKNKWTDADLLLYSAYFNSMKEAYDHGCTNIAFSLLSSGIFRGSGSKDKDKDKDRGLKNVISIGILAVVNFAIALERVVDVFFYAYGKNEYNILAELITKYNIDPDNSWKNFASDITDFNTDYLTTNFIDINLINTKPKYENLQLAYDAIAIKPGPGLGEATPQQVEIFAKFKASLEDYKPPTHLDYKQFGQFILEGHQVIDKKTNKTDYVRTKRVAILVDTLKLFETKTTEYYNSAKENMLNWCKKVTPRNEKGLEVIVEPIDWGEMALKCTKKYGSIFACLNMANSETPGGGYQNGPAAQEENMFRRTNCHFSIIRDSMLNPNKDKSFYSYKQSYQYLIGAKDGINTYIDVTSPRICIKDKETWKPEMGNNAKGTQNIGYKLYDASNIFLFYELRCAAVYIDSPDQFNETEMEKIIHAQFKTLMKKGIRHAILGAFGCGAFHNPPLEVAALYKECLMLYKDDFDVIAFPIYYAGSGLQNYPSFRKILLNSPDDENTSSIFYNGDAEAIAEAEADAEANESPKVVTPLAANAAAIAAAINPGANAAVINTAIKKNKTSVKKGHEKAVTEKAGTGKAAKPTKVLAAKPAKAGTDEAETDEVGDGTGKAAKPTKVLAAKPAKAGTDEAETDEVGDGTEENGSRQAGRKDLAQSGSADNGTVNGNVSDDNSNPSPSYDISPEGSNGQGMLIGFLILCTLGIGAVSFIK